MELDSLFESIFDDLNENVESIKLSLPHSDNYNELVGYIPEALGYFLESYLVEGYGYWMDGGLVDRLSLENNQFIIEGAMIWGKDEGKNSGWWTDAFSLTIDLDSRTYCLCFGNLNKLPVSINKLRYWDPTTIEWRFIFQSD